APINDCEAANLGTTSCTKDGEGGSGLFGGTNPTDDSGTLNYVRVQYAGFLFGTDDELNGIAFQGVGSETEVDYIHVHNNADDAVEFFGGTVNAQHVVVSGFGDDGIDWTDGWNGAIQYAVVVQTDTLSGDPRGFEGDSNGDFPNRDPRSNPVIANFTAISQGASSGDDGMKIRRGTDGVFANGIVTGYNGDGVDFDLGTSTESPQFLSIYVAGNGNATDSDATPLFNADPNNVRGSTELANVFSIAATRGVTPADLNDGDDNDADLPRDGIEEVTYIGAFEESVQRYEDSWLFSWALPIDEFASSTSTSQCPDGTVLSQNTSVPSGRSEARVCTILSPVVGDVFLPAGNLYELDGSVFVGRDLGGDPANENADGEEGTLTIAAGVTLFGLNGPDALIVTRGSQLFANGTAANPVVMTSLQDVRGQSTAAGQWGGLVINGRAPINDCEAAVLGTVNCEKDGEGGSGLFGGQTADDNSGRLNYVRVSYAGFLFGADDELNGIAFQGVGSGTEVDFIQVHQNADDGVEFFGGTVNAKHVVVTNAGDDSFDWTDGWTGDVQYVILYQPTGISGDPRVIEGDNNGNFPSRSPRSNPTIANLTVIDQTPASNAQDAIKIRRGSGAAIYNAIVAGNDAGDGIDYDASTPATLPPTFFSTYVVDFPTPLNLDGSPSIFDAANLNENGEDGGEDSTLTIAAGATVALVPGANENLSTTTVPGSFFDQTNYIGAVEDASDTWYLGWTVGL
ncbi:MAG: hypothetical protein V2I43_25500, partial [Parvularcula sp.]|nr:hypothetical protein [Parvularcula sp.]